MNPETLDPKTTCLDPDYEPWLDSLIEEDERMDFNCGLGPDGQCALAGTEDCDWDCPNSHGPRYAGSAAWNEVHDAGVPVDGCMCLECEMAREGKT